MATVICLHCSGGSARQWTPLAAALAPEHPALAPDLIGYGRDTPWIAGGRTTIRTRDDRRRLELAA